MKTRLAVPTWLTTILSRDTGRRIVFSLLAAWMHFTAMFYVIMALPHGANGIALTQRPQANAITVSLHSLPISQPPTPDAPQSLNLLDQLQLTESVTDTAARLLYGTRPEVSRLSVTSTLPNLQDEPKKEGLIDCETLTKKPERIVFSDHDNYLRPDGTPPGYAIVHETIRRDGSVAVVTVEESTMSGKMLNQVINLAYASYFHPGEIDGVAVDCDFKWRAWSEPINPEQQIQKF